MKNLKLLLLLVCTPFTFYAQQLSGLWIGTLSNDSNSVRQDQSFEIVLSQYKEKVYGYSRSTFLVNDTLYYIVKRVKGTINGDVCEVKDDHIVSHNFPKKRLDKGVKVISTFRRNLADSSWYLAGDWKTTQTKKYYTVTGKVDLKEEKDYSASKLFPHLEELGLDKDVPFYAAAKKAAEPPVTAKTTPPAKPATTVSNTGTASVEEKKPVVAKNEIKEDVKAKEAGKAEPKTIPAEPAPLAATENKPVTTDKKTAGITKPETAAPVNQGAVAETKNTVPATNSTAARTIPETQKTVTAKPEQKPASTEPVNPIASANTKPTKPAAEPKQPEVSEQPAGMEDLGHALKKYNSPTAPRTEPAATTKPAGGAAEKKPVTTPVKNEVALAKPATATEKTIPAAAPAKTPAQELAASLVSQRKIEAPQYITYVSDSLVLILYDNGEVDGDTVSVFLNGEILMSKQGLKTSAIRKTIYITPGKEDLTLVLFAENLGKYPPNTGLLVVYDGEERHQLRFTADLQKNAAVEFRRKR